MIKNQQKLRSTGNSDTNLIVIIRLLLSRFYWIILSGLLLAAIVFVSLKLFVTPTYESRVSFYVYNSSDTATHGTINNSDLQAAESLAETYSKILGSNSVLDAVIDDLGDDINITRRELSKMTRASVISDTQLLEVVITSTDPQFSCKVASSFATVASTEIVRITKAGGVEVVDRPEVPTEIASPRILFDTVLSFIIGAVIASIIIVVRMLSDITIYLPEDLERIDNVTLLGQIPEINISDANYTPWQLIEGGIISDEKNGTK